MLGPAPWLAFAGNVAIAGRVLDAGALPLPKMPSVFAALRLLGAPSFVALGLHALVPLAAAGLVGWLWWRGAPPPLAAAALVTGSLLMPPHTNDHDLALPAVPIALLAWDGQRRGWRPAEREILALAWLCPPITAPLAAQAGLQIAIPLVATLLVMAAQRTCLTPDRPLGATPSCASHGTAAAARS